MDFEALKKALAEGKITQAEFEAKCKELGVDNDGNKLQPEIDATLKEYIDKLVAQASQSSADRVRTEYSLKLKALEEQNALLLEQQKSSMTDAEKKAFEFEQAQKDFEKKQKEFAEQSRKFTATQVLNKFGLLDESMSFLPFVVGDTEEEMTKNVEILKASIDKSIEAKVQARFKESGRNLDGSGDGNDKPDKDVEFAKELAKQHHDTNKEAEESQSYYFGDN